MTTPVESIEQLAGAVDRDAIATAARVLQLQAVHDKAAARARVERQVPVPVEQK